jgi:putative membrane protein
MKIKASDFFSPEEKEKISESIRKAESETSGEIAIMVLDSSDSYSEAETFGAFVLSGLFSLKLELIISYLIGSESGWGHGGSGFPYGFLTDAAKSASIWTYIPMVFIFYFAFKFLLSKFPEIKILFMSGRRIEETVRERAVMAFYEKGLYKTRDETGILIFISLLEHKVWILGDRGINAKIAPDFWEKIAMELSAGIGKKEYGKAACQAITKCGEELSRYFPIKKDDTNELTNEVIL